MLAAEDLWGERSCLVFLPCSGSVVRLARATLLPLDQGPPGSIDDLIFACAAARVADAIDRDAVLAPLESPVEPLPHQIHALERALSGDRIRYLLADEVGLGKTIEAGLILRELKLRGLVRRTLVVAPAGLCTQWAGELQTHFHERFRVLLPGQFAMWRQVAGLDEHENLWRLHDQVICSLDAVKPLDTRRGWTAEQVARHNRERLHDIASAGWDLIIVDEAHRLAGSTDQVARYRLGEVLSKASPYLLLLSATPHQGKTDAFRRLLGLLDPCALPDDASVCREAVASYVIRTEKRHAIDAFGRPLFQPRRTQLVAVDWPAARPAQRALYEAVSEYVQQGYNQALRERRNAFGFLMILMQRLVTSSTAAIQSTLARRLEVLRQPESQLTLLPEEAGDDWAALGPDEQLDLLIRARGLESERGEVESLLSAARCCEAQGADGKAEVLLGWIHRLQREEDDPAVKLLIFTEFLPTQDMLAEFLRHRSFSVACLNGALDMEKRRQVQAAFAGDVQILVSTDAGGEGLNLQFCHVVINYDLPWNPMKLEQRIGRVDRIGQRHFVRALNFALEDTVELRVREVLEEKLQLILDEFGVDKLSDVLDSEEGGVEFEGLYARAVLRPGEAAAQATAVAEEMRRRAKVTREGQGLLGTTGPLDTGAAARVAGHRLPFWTERMTLSFLRSRQDAGAIAELDEIGYRLRWPDGHEVRRAVFGRDESEAPGSVFLSLDEARVRALASNLPVAASGQPAAVLRVAGVSDKVSGFWSLWRVAIETAEGRMQRLLPLFLNDDGRVLTPTARVIWDRLIELDPGSVLPMGWLSGTAVLSAYQVARQVAEAQGKDLFQALLREHHERFRREQRKTAPTFLARRRAIECIGLPEVRCHRSVQLDAEERRWTAEIAARESALPELSAVLLLRVAREGESA